jgi:hypothetical protein
MLYPAELRGRAADAIARLAQGLKPGMSQMAAIPGHPASARKGILCFGLAMRHPFQ